jgi:pumilio family protein 6
MAYKTATTKGGEKRKASSAAKSDGKDRTKKVKLDSSAKPKPVPAPANKFNSARKSLVSKDESDDENDSSGFSDSDDGGAELNGKSAKPKFDKSADKKSSRPSNGESKEFSKGLWYLFPFLIASSTCLT